VAVVLVVGAKVGGAVLVHHSVGHCVLESLLSLATLAAAAAARAQAGEPEAAAAEIMEKQLVSKISADHAMAGVECPVCLDTPCEVVLPCNHGCCHICLDKLITRGARLTLCPICRERIMPPTIEPVVVTAPGEVAAGGDAATNGGADGTNGGSTDGGSNSRPAWRRMLPTPLPPREWVAVAWWRRRRQQRRQQVQLLPTNRLCPLGQSPCPCADPGAPSLDRSLQAKLCTKCRHSSIAVRFKWASSSSRTGPADLYCVPSSLLRLTHAQRRDS
jgi:hypothetical protein